MTQTIEATPPDLHSGQIEVIQALEEKRQLQIHPIYYCCLWQEVG